MHLSVAQQSTRSMHSSYSLEPPFLQVFTSLKHSLFCKYSSIQQLKTPFLQLFCSSKHPFLQVFMSPKHTLFCKYSPVQNTLFCKCSPVQNTPYSASTHQSKTHPFSASTHKYKTHRFLQVPIRGKRQNRCNARLNNVGPGGVSF